MSKRNVHLLPTPPTTYREGYQSHRHFQPDESTATRNVDYTDPFRFGFPSPLPALPLETGHVSVLSPIRKQFDSIHYDVNVSLRERGILKPHATMVQRSEPDEEPTENDYTILISAAKEDTLKSNEAWFHAVNDIAGLLIDRELNFCIELMDPRADRKYFPAKISPEFTEAWPVLNVSILGTLDFRREWHSLSLLNRGSTRDSSVPTVTVDITKAASHKWQKEKFKALCAILSQWEVDVALIRSSFWFVKDRLDLELDQITLDRVHPGTSIGSSRQSGTLGGYVTILYQGNEYFMGLTSTRAIETDEMTQEEKAFGLPPNLSRPSPELRAPSDLDVEATIRKWESRAHAYRESLFRKAESEKTDGPSKQQGLAHQLEERGDSAKPQLIERVETLKRHLKWIEELIDEMNAFPRDCGTVFASSGTHRYHGEEQVVWDDVNQKHIKIGNAINWALVNTKPSRTGNNTTPYQNSWLNYVYAPMGGTKEITSAAKEEPACGDHMFKKGPDGHRVGEVNAFKSCINMGDGDGDNRFYRATGIVGLKGTSFPGSGDSGCWGLDNCAFLTAMGIGGEREANTAFMVPIEWIFADIEKRTGARILSPVLTPSVVRMIKDNTW